LISFGCPYSSFQYCSNSAHFCLHPYGIPFPALLPQVENQVVQLGNFAIPPIPSLGPWTRSSFSFFLKLRLSFAPSNILSVFFHCPIPSRPPRYFLWRALPLYGDFIRTPLSLANYRGGAHLFLANFVLSRVTLRFLKADPMFFISGPLLVSNDLVRTPDFSRSQEKITRPLFSILIS